MTDSEIVDRMAHVIAVAQEEVEMLRDEMQYPDEAKGYLEGGMGKLEAALNLLDEAAANLEKYEEENDV